MQNGAADQRQIDEAWKLSSWIQDPWRQGLRNASRHPEGKKAATFSRRRFKSIFALSLSTPSPESVLQLRYANFEKRFVNTECFDSEP